MKLGLIYQYYLPTELRARRYAWARKHQKATRRQITAHHPLRSSNTSTVNTNKKSMERKHERNHYH